MKLPKDSKYHMIYTVREKNISHRSFEKVIGQNIEF
jgi:hypothetical protein